VKAKNLDAMNGGWLGVFIAPTTKGAVGAPARWILTVGASDICATGQSGGAPDSHCSLSGAPSGSALTSARTVAH
jgi:hypothetical protein